MGIFLLGFQCLKILHHFRGQRQRAVTGGRFCLVYCPTPEALRDSLLNAYESFRELEITGGDRDLTEKEEATLAKERDALTALCEKEAAKCSS